jgi:hypothetical protein
MIVVDPTIALALETVTLLVPEVIQIWNRIDTPKKEESLAAGRVTVSAPEVVSM